MIVIAWISLRDDFDMPGDDPELDTGVQAKNRESLSHTDQIDIISNIFKRERPLIRSWSLARFAYFKNDDGTLMIPLEIKRAIDSLKNDNPGKTRVLGAWDWDGKQFGKEWVFDIDGIITGTTGVPTYPLYGNLLKYMPDIIGHDEEGNVISTTPATILTSVNLLQGQKEQRFD